MFKAATRHEHLTRSQGDFAERFHANGGYEGFRDVPEMYQPLLLQYKARRARILELSQKQDLTPEERRERENHIRQCGSWAAQLRDGAQMAFERMFMIVAQARIPKEHFGVIVDEAPSLWRTLGFDGVGPTNRTKKKAIKARQKHYS